ncbi:MULTISPECIES: hypothetical protein [unclassified Breznakia]|uniref:hypothetical protein n=1 Tax=unclassified Breznakia TaxID=2623764 RepID=UPI0024736902|nr:MULTISPECIES: hypothetical protein [unclassified Breznakia]MDH6367042.1 hypothetical protein [Breznakia sp. PH1-1]MDH6404186.1 hypothetical protein [Breznakia sp. PF1-11]MDH6411929.1 hypothetical protein [Breznakia sp. PFB1-11]MDH6414174.1 hypothetical protein [Breznakia sp. PFB1-14]MDH6418927.1 hypothetical protein [Breznakia sp. PFB1-12]
MKLTYFFNYLKDTMVEINWIDEETNSYMSLFTKPVYFYRTVPYEILCLDMTKFEFNIDKEDRHLVIKQKRKK